MKCTRCVTCNRSSQLPSSGLMMKVLDWNILRVCCSLWYREGALRNLHKQISYCGVVFFSNYLTTEAWRNKTQDIRDDYSSTWIHFCRSTLSKPGPAELELNTERWKNTKLVWLIVVMVCFGFLNSSLSWWCCLSEWNFRSTDLGKEVAGSQRQFSRI